MSLSGSVLIPVLTVKRALEHKIRSAFRRHRHRKDSDDRKVYGKLDNAEEAQPRTASDIAREDFTRGDFMC
ncbi:hypothetical protein DPSP01_009717 [Paraphaeosphaeria sporulosa]